VHRIGVAGTPAQAALVSSEPTCIPSATEHLNGGVVAFALVGVKTMNWSGDDEEHGDDVEDEKPSLLIYTCIYC